jgi:hypothetical protein
MRPTITIRDMVTARAGDHVLEHTGRSLRTYLQPLKLMHVATRSSLWDKGNIERGRVRTSYVPEAGAVILITAASFSPARAFGHGRISQDSRSKVAQVVPMTPSAPAPAKEEEPAEDPNPYGVEQI